MRPSPQRGAARPALLLAVASLLALAQVPPARAFIEEATTASDLRLRLDWNKMGCVGSSKITFEIDSDGSADVTPASDGTDALVAAINTWDKPSSGIPETSFDVCPPVVTQLGTFNGNSGFANDGHNKIYFAETDTGGTLGSSTVALTNFWFTTGGSNPPPGTIVDCDTVFNGFNFIFSVDGTPGTQDIQAVEAHEFGHCLGLDHSPVYGKLRNLSFIEDNNDKATMFPYVFGTAARTLQPDDIMGVQFFYPTTADTPPSTLGSISGHVYLGTNPTQEIRGAYVHAISTSAPRVPVRGRMSDLGQTTEAGAGVGPGGYVITGLPPGTYDVFIEPLNGSTPNPFSTDNILAADPFDTSFPPEFYNGAGESATDDPMLRTAVTVTAGSNTPDIDFLTNSSSDYDADGVTDYTDNCPDVTNATQTDSDGDGVGNVCDLCPSVADPDQFDTDGDLVGDACDPDDDNDGLLDTVETNTGVFVSASDTGTNPLNPDTDGDGYSDGAEVAAGSDPNDPASHPGGMIPTLGATGAGLLALALLAAGRHLLRRR